MFTNEQIDKLLTNYKENGKELSGKGTKSMYSTVLRGKELISVRKDLVKEGDRLVISDAETLAIITSVDSIVRSRGLVQFRKVFADKFNQVLSQSSVYLGDVGKPVDVSILFKLVSNLKTTVKRLKYYNRVELKASDETIEENHGRRLLRLNLSVVNNRLISRAYTKELEYILDNNYNQNFYKLLTRDKRVLDLINVNLYTEQDVRRFSMENGGSKVVNELQDEVVSCLKKANEFEIILADIVIETGKLIKEYEVSEVKGVSELISDCERLLQDCIEQDLSGISAGLHSEKLKKLSVTNKRAKELIESDEYEIVNPLLDELYSATSVEDNDLTFDFEYYLNSEIVEYGVKMGLKVRKADYCGVLVGDSDLVLTKDEAKAVKELVTLIHELFMFVYKKDGQLNVYK